MKPATTLKIKNTIAGRYECEHKQGLNSVRKEEGSSMFEGGNRGIMGMVPCDSP